MKHFLEMLYIGHTGIKPLDWLSDKYHDITGWFGAKKEMIERMIFWAWKMRYSYDFEALTIYDMLYFKLDRIYACMRDHGNCVWSSDENSKRMRRLCEAKYLAGWLSKNAPDSSNKRLTRVMERYDKEKRGSGYLDRIHTKLYPNAKIIDSKLLSLMVNKAVSKDIEEYKNKKERFLKLIDKHLDEWWD